MIFRHYQCSAWAPGFFYLIIKKQIVGCEMPATEVSCENGAADTGPLVISVKGRTIQNIGSVLSHKVIAAADQTALQ
jgi:hypothetical protein